MNVDCSAEIKFLGIQIIDTLKWHCHVQLLAGELCCVVWGGFCGKIYFTNLHSVLRFGILFCGGAAGELTAGIVRVQNQVIRPTVAVTAQNILQTAI